ncbi:MAG: type 4a pilus biogenesis protein PilO [Burkholderiales bacterium]
MAISDQFRGVNLGDWKQWGTMPALPKIIFLLVLVAVVMAICYFALWKEQYETYESLQAEEVKLKAEYKKKKTDTVNLELYREQVREIETSFGTLLKQLPNKSQMEALLVEINQAGLGRGLQFELFKPAAQETTREFYAELPITLKIVGSYHDMGAFASDIAQLSRIVTLNDVALSVAKDGNLTMDTTARTYRYLDDDELAEQKKAAAAKAAKAAKK